MPLQTPRPAPWGDSRPGLDDYRERRESEAPLVPNPFQRQALTRLRRQRLVKCVHILGARATFELIDEVAGRFGIEQYVDDRLEAYASRLTPRLPRLTGGDKFPALPMRAVGGLR
jgi:hypothetical protein